MLILIICRTFSVIDVFDENNDISCEKQMSPFKYIPG